MKEMIKKIIEDRGNVVINTLMAIGVIPYMLSILYGITLNALRYKYGLIWAYIIPTTIVIFLFIFKLCNPLTIAIGHGLLLPILILIGLLIPWLRPVPGGYYALYYTMYMSILTLIGAVFYYIFCYTEKTVVSNIVVVVFTIYVVIGWIVMYNEL